MERIKLFDAEYRLMDIIWDREPVNSTELSSVCQEKLGWKKPTTYTVLRKLCQRGFCQNQDTIVTALVPKEQVQVYQSEHFVDRVFDGSLPQFLTAFLDGRALSQEEAEEIRSIIDRYSGQ